MYKRSIKKMERRCLIIIAIILAINIMVFAQQTKNQNSNFKILNAWARPAVKNANSALYFIVKNNSNKVDTLFGVESKVAEMVEVHESFKKDNDKTGMRLAGKLAIRTMSEFEFKPGGFHIMLLGVVKDLKIGDSLEVVLQFKYARKIKVKAEVRDMPMANEKKK